MPVSKLADYITSKLVKRMCQGGFLGGERVFKSVFKLRLLIEPPILFPQRDFYSSHEV